MSTQHQLTAIKEVFGSRAADLIEQFETIGGTMTEGDDTAKPFYSNEPYDSVSSVAMPATMLARARKVAREHNMRMADLHRTALAFYMDHLDQAVVDTEH